MPSTQFLPGTRGSKHLLNVCKYKFNLMVGLKEKLVCGKLTSSVQNTVFVVPVKHPGGDFQGTAD